MAGFAQGFGAAAHSKHECLYGGLRCTMTTPSALEMRHQRFERHVIPIARNLLGRLAPQRRVDVARGWPRALRSSASRQRAQKPGLTHVVPPQVAHDEGEARRRSTISRSSEIKERQLVPIRSDSAAQNSRRFAVDDAMMFSGLSEPHEFARLAIVAIPE